jgi:hypothetical protein
MSQTFHEISAKNQPFRTKQGAKTTKKYDLGLQINSMDLFGDLVEDLKSNITKVKAKSPSKAVILTPPRNRSKSKESKTAPKKVEKSSPKIKEERITRSRSKK